MQTINISSEKVSNGSENVRTANLTSAIAPDERSSAFRAYAPDQSSISGTDLFSLFTADIIKKEVLFTR